MSKYGIDVSHHNGKIDWGSVKNQVDFAILKLGNIGDGNKFWLDDYFEDNYNECKRLNIPIGVYVYCYTNEVENIDDCAKKVSDYMKDKKLELPIYIDMEDKEIESEGKTKLTELVFSFNTIIEQSGFWAGVYANKNWFDNYLDKDKIKNRFTTWIAAYSSGTDRFSGEYDMWQNSSSGKINGISGNVDTNYMYRDLISEIKGSKTSENTKTEIPTKVENTANETTYTVKSGDTLSAIAQKYNTTVDNLVILNNIADKNKIFVGQVLRINCSVTVQNETVYTVKAGDTLSGIAKKYGTTYQAIAQKNGIVDPDKIYVGQVLKI